MLEDSPHVLHGQSTHLLRTNRSPSAPATSSVTSTVLAYSCSRDYPQGVQL